jgi:enoyl-CoA hydratase/carnithine racemase
MTQRDRAIDWAKDDTATVLAKLNSADGAPGVLDELFGQPCYLYDAHAVPGWPPPGAQLGRSGDDGVVRACRDGAVKIGHVRHKEGAPSIKLPVALSFPEVALLPEWSGGGDEIRYEEVEGVGYLYFDFYNGVMGSEACQRLLATYEAARQRPTRVIVLMGGADFFSNGLDLNRIEAAASPPDESWRNINAMDDLCRAILTTGSHLTVSALRGNAGAGGAYLALAADRVWARRGVILNPHYKNMGNLYGSEYWTYLLPRRMGEAGAAVGPALRLVLRTGFLPGSLSASVGGVTVTDDGAGNAMSGATVIGTASYATGEILFGANAPSASGTATITYRPAAAAANQAHTLARQVTAENRRLNWVETLAPLPAPRALQLSYMAQGNWYTLRDDGNGNIVGSEPGFGAGTISYVTGALSVTLGALPDVGSQIMLTWGSPAHYAVRAGATADAGATLRLEYVLQTSPVVPGSLTISYPVGGATRTATDAAANGNITGTGVSGTINYATGAVTLDFSTPPDAAANVANAYTWRDGTGLLSGTTATISGGTFTVPGQAPFRNSGSMTFSAATNNGAISCAGYITSGGQIRVAGGRARQPDGNYTVWLDQPVGTFDAATGVVTLTNGVTVALNAYQTISHQWQYQTQSATIGGVSAIAVERDTAAFNPAAVTGETVAPGAVGLTLDLTATVGDPVVATSVLLSVTGSLYVDRGGVLYQDPSVTTGAALVAGSIDYSSGRATLTRWADNTAVGVQVLACLTQYGEWKAIDASFRAPVAPLKPESVTITSTAADGAQITAAADPDGVIAGTYARGAVNYEFGTAWVEFGELVAGVWQPREVLPATIRYNAVGYTYLPLNADILGIDPVRLPPDGRVPIYRPGDVVMILHAADTAPQTVLTGGTVELGRTRIAWVRVIDATGASVTSGYTLDRAAGIVTFADVAGIAMPVTVRHTVGDLRQITDAQISGQLTVARPLTHAFPAGESIVASCLIHGDRRARVSAVWDQATWDGTWADSIKGSEATATLDVIAHPITVTNEGAETERWLLRWTSTTNVELIGERRGLVYSGAFTADIAPINSRTRNTDGTGGTPYLTIPVAANGGGWSAGNVVRINTVGALADIWLARSIQQSDEPLGTGADGCELYALGNIDRP